MHHTADNQLKVTLVIIWVILSGITGYLNWKYVRGNHSWSWRWFWLRCGIAFLGGIAFGLALVEKPQESLLTNLVIVFGSGLWFAFWLGYLGEHKIRSTLKKRPDHDESTENREWLRKR